VKKVTGPPEREKPFPAGGGRRRIGRRPFCASGEDFGNQTGLSGVYKKEGLENSEAVPIAEVFRFASENCRRQGETSREYVVYFKIIQRGRRQFWPQSWVLRLLVQLLKEI
jgi:hypothetical protein